MDFDGLLRPRAICRQNESTAMITPAKTSTTGILLTADGVASLQGSRNG
jgi:hypothetical protein|tara:strand:- start:377 stop:523 length:147 start_codon:yes stop_codon:yes gene_type:complete